MAQGTPRPLKSSGAVMAATSISRGKRGIELRGALRGDCAGLPDSFIVYPDPEPYRVDDRLYRPFSGAETGFNRALAGPPGTNCVTRLEATLAARTAAADPAFPRRDTALRRACEAPASRLGFSGLAFDFRMEAVGFSFADGEPVGPPDESVADPAEAARLVKRAARFLGADLVGVAALDPRWVYSEVWLLDQQRRAPLRLPDDCRWAVVMAVAMDAGTMTPGPSALGYAGTTAGYAAMAATTLAVAEFIRHLGFRAIATTNDTALSIPMAIDAGLGELSRSGMLMTPQYGPRQRLAKVITSLPLEPDRPIGFGVRAFCRTCGLCAAACPVSAVPSDPERTWSGPSVSSNPGVLKWYIDPDRCLEAWAAAGTACTTCIAVCPYNRVPVDRRRTRQGSTCGATADWWS